MCAYLAPVGVAATSTEVPYVALGDSYSSGEGNGPFDGKCHRAQRSDSAYPRMLPGLVGYLAPPHFHACTGATTADVWQRPQPRRGDQRIQLEYLSPSTKLVTMTIGGNDLGFSEVVFKCLLPGDCTGWKVAERVKARMGAIKAELIALYARIRQRMDSDGLLIVAGYPHLFVRGGADCERFISVREAAWMNSLVDSGNARIAEATRAARRQSGNVSYVDVSERFSGHELCSKEPWLYGIELTLGNGIYKASYHPRRAGQQAYAASFATFLRQPAIRAALSG